MRTELQFAREQALRCAKFEQPTCKYLTGRTVFVVNFSCLPTGFVTQDLAQCKVLRAESVGGRQDVCRRTKEPRTNPALFDCEGRCSHIVDGRSV